ncbi:hypothetical protein [Streptomyces albogriseolus]|uniref:hypothetical protein n=1 Tax=Streptomyces albogriseolus TaxID=1887 RepID=UPI00378A168B
MRLASVIEAAVTKQQFVDYANACANVNRYALSIANTQIPSVMYPPPNYGDFVQRFQPARTDCILWAGTIFPDAVSYPHVVKRAETLFAIDDHLASRYLDRLIADPGDRESKEGLAETIEDMQEIVSRQLLLVESLLADFSNFAQRLPGHSEALKDLAGKSVDAANLSRETIKKLNAAIEDLKKEIDTLNFWLVTSEIGMAASVFFGLCGLVVCFVPVPGAQVVGVSMIVLAVLGEGASIAGTVVLNEQVGEKNKQLDDLRIINEKEIDVRKQEILQFEGVAKQFEWLEDAQQKAQNSLSVIRDMWKSLDAELSDVKRELTDLESSAGSVQYQQAKDDLEEAERQWGEVIEFAEALDQLDYRWQDQDGKWYSYGDKSPRLNEVMVTALPATEPQ